MHVHYLPAYDTTHAMARFNRRGMLRRSAIGLAIPALALTGPPANRAAAQEATPAAQGESGYADVNGLHMYYEIHGSGGVPLVLLHGAFSNFETDFGKVLPMLAATRQVIGIEQQAHGRTADIDRPLSYEQMAEDTVALLRSLNIEQADFFAYSFGGDTAMQIAVHHPELARKLVLSGGVAFQPEGLYPELSAGSESMTAADLANALQGTPWQQAYARLAPNPDDWMTLVEKKMALDKTWHGYPTEMISSLQQPVLLIIGDSDISKPEHVVEMFRLLGGGVPGDLYGLPASQLAILPGTTHVTLVDRADWLASMVIAFLDAPMPEAS
jgi:pimeloyl-ACP methyl ester carboxylesterase